MRDYETQNRAVLATLIRVAQSAFHDCQTSGRFWLPFFASFGAKIVMICLSLAVLFPQFSLANPQLFLEMIENENKNTLGTSVTTAPHDLEFVEVPLDQLQIFKGEGMSEGLSDLLIDESRGVYRWVFHPTDSKYRAKILTYLKSQGLPTKIYQGQIEGYLTISRSLFVRRAGGGDFYGLKTSTDQAPAGPWRDRPQQIRSSVSSLLVSDYLNHVEHRVGVTNGIALPEPLLVTFPGVNLAQNGRLYPELNAGTHRYFPTTAIFSEEGQAFIKSWLGPSAGFEDFKTHFGRLMGRYMAEMYMKGGVMASSSHLQQFLLSQSLSDQKDVKIIWRDHADSHLHLPALAINGAHQLIEHSRWINFSTRRVYTHDGVVIFSPFHGWMEDTSIPSDHPAKLFFSDGDEAESWQIRFFEGMQYEFQNNTGVRFDLRNRSEGPHIMFEISGSETAHYCTQILAGRGPFALPKYQIQFPPED